MELIDSFQKYISFGWQVIAVHANSKSPVFRKWNQQFYHHLIHQSYLVKNPKSNIALRLGKIIDVEADSQDTNDFLNYMLKNVPHMQYDSTRGTHHLFINPFKTLRKKIIKGIEFRGYGHCSMLPPSVSKEGVPYQWRPESTQKLTTLPECLKNILNPHPGPKLSIVQCESCNEKIVIHEIRLKKEMQVFLSKKNKWQCRKCRNFDIRPYCKKIARN